VALFLALAAIQFVVDNDLPQSSYVTPFQQLTVTSYATLLLVGAECVLIWCAWLGGTRAQCMRTTHAAGMGVHFSTASCSSDAAVMCWWCDALLLCCLLRAPGG
jgi:hypothetical protein